MLSSEEQMQIIKSAIAEGYKGEIFKLIDQASIEKGAIAQNQEQQEQGLRGSDGNTAMAFPNSDQDFNTQGMDFDLDMLEKEMDAMTQEMSDAELAAMEKEIVDGFGQSFDEIFGGTE